jgi:hypothetical protein
MQLVGLKDTWESALLDALVIHRLSVMCGRPGHLGKCAFSCISLTQTQCDVQASTVPETSPISLRVMQTCMHGCPGHLRTSVSHLGPVFWLDSLGMLTIICFCDVWAQDPWVVAICSRLGAHCLAPISIVL